MFGLGIIPSALFFIGALLLPESPRWLVNASRQEEALQILKKIGNDTFAQTTLSSIQSASGNSIKQGYGAAFKKGVLPAVLTGIGLAFFQQLCGINVVFNYTPRIFQSIGVSQDDQLLQTVFIGVVNLVFTILAMLLVDRLGHKPLMLIGSVGLCILYIIAVRMLASGSSAISWFLLSSIGVYAVALAPVTWVLISEIFPNKVRSSATSIAIISLWTACFILVFTFPILFDKLGDKTFCIYSAVCFIGCVF